MGASNYDHLQVLGETAWEGVIAVALGGDRSVAANEFWSSLNIVTTMQVPIQYFFEDNGYGLSVLSTIQTPGGNIAANLASFKGFTVIDADGTQPEEAWQAISNAVQHVRAGKGPALLLIRVVRIQGHTFIDDQSLKLRNNLFQKRNWTLFSICVSFSSL